MAREQIFPRWVAVALAFAALAGCRKPEARETAERGDSALPVPITPSSLSVQVREARGHAHLVIEQRPAALEIRLVRPKPDDRRILLAVAGTYTSPEGRPEGLVVIDGRVVEKPVKPWEGLLIVRNGVPVLRRAEERQLSADSLLELIGPHASSIQGHLLVDAEVQRLKPSPALRRRALATRSDSTFFFVESQIALPLADFAADLQLLGARYALNLDMGEWSEGFYRNPVTHEKIPLGDDYRKTAHQTNWLVLLGPDASGREPSQSATSRDP